MCAEPLHYKEVILWPTEKFDQGNLAPPFTPIITPINGLIKKDPGVTGCS